MSAMPSANEAVELRYSAVRVVSFTGVNPYAFRKHPARRRPPLFPAPPSQTLPSPGSSHWWRMPV